MKFNLPLLYLLLGIILSSGCGTSKDTVTSRGMQNLTARYNIIYNARILLDESRRNMESASPENYSELISVYKEPSEADAQSVAGNLDSVILKAKTIVDEKVYSKYVDDAYFLIGEANYYKASFFNAAEFFTYVYNSYPDQQALRQKALVFQIRSLLQLDKLEEAKISLDTALKHVNDSKRTKRIAADVYATAAQYLIKVNNEPEAIEMLEKALDSKGVKENKLRWTYVLAQLQDRNKQYDAAYKNYTAIVRSNAPFDMAFNAGLNRISIDDSRNGKGTDKILRLKSLLKNEKNKNFIDQIYYRIGDVYLERNQSEEAIASYNQAIRSSSNNQNQKGLAYLRIADIYFQHGDYVGAKSYYDSTLTSLSPSYPGYDIIRRKGNNLELLADRFKVIGREDTLQMLAALPESEREARIGALVREQVEKSQVLSLNNQMPGSMVAGIDRTDINGTATEGKFYFNNTTAISQGLTDFKRRWGNRPLEDNWRRSGKSSAEEFLNQADNPDAPVAVQRNSNPATINPDAIRNTYISNLPLTESALKLSNQRIADAYYDIASFYKDELKDNTEAIKTFEELLKRVPESTYTLSVYYNLYRLYTGINEDRSAYYKNLLLTQYPESPFAKAIKDPDYAKKTDEKEVALNAVYNQIYDLYTEKKYQEVLKEIAKTEQQYGVNFLSPQLAYLNSLATGHLQKLPAFEAALQKIVDSYPEDKLITPLVKEHLLYIKNNKSLFAGRATALTEHNPLEPIFIEPTAQQPVIAQTRPAQVDPQKSKPEVIVPPTTEKTTVEPPVKKAEPEITQPPVEVQTETPPQVDDKPIAEETKPTEPVITEAPIVTKPKPLYDLPETGEYYFVINVQDIGANLNSSRFGVGQFNRSRFSGSSIKHQLKAVNDENQLIFIGAFDNYDSAKYYERSILPLLKDIMKVQAEKYNTFVITKQELDKLTNGAQISSYLEFYKNNR